MVLDRYLGTKDAAAFLGVSERRLQAMVADGAIDAERVAGRYLFDRAVLRDLARVDRHPGRPLGAEMAWATLMLASGQPLPVERPAYRTRRARDLLNTRGLGGLRHGLRRRGAAWRFAGHPSVLARLRDAPEVVLSGVSAAQHWHLGIASSDEVEGYVRASDLADVCSRFALSRASDGPILLRVVDDAAWVLEADYAPVAAVAVDLGDARDARSREVSEHVIGVLDDEGPDRYSAAERDTDA